MLKSLLQQSFRLAEIEVEFFTEDFFRYEDDDDREGFHILFHPEDYDTVHRIVKHTMMEMFGGRVKEDVIRGDFFYSYMSAQAWICKEDSYVEVQY